MRIIFLKGNNSEIAEGYFKSSKVVKKNLKYYNKLRKKIFTRNSRGFFKKSIIKVFELYYYKFFEKNLDDNYREFIKEFSIASKIKYKNFSKLVLIPDVLTYVFSKVPSLKIPHYTLGCSSCIRKLENGIEHGRNLDFFGGNIWSGSHEVVVVTPEVGQKFISVSAEGFFSPGITAINESYLSISLHMLYSEEVNKKGVPILNLVYNILLNSSTLDDVREYLKRSKPITAWGLLITDHKSGEVSVFEITGKNFQEYKVDGETFGYVNKFITELKKSEYLFSYLWIENNNNRIKRIDELLENETTIVDILSDRTGQDFIANNFTISSAIFNPKDDELLVADNKVPASIGEYRCFVLSELFAGNVKERDKISTLNSSTFNRDNIKNIVDAYDNYLVSCNKSKFLKSIENIDQMPAPLFKAVILAKKGRLQLALKCIDELIKGDSLKGYRLFTTLLLKGIFLDIYKKREESITIYRELLLNQHYPDIIFYCLKFLKKPASKRYLERIDINMFLSHIIIV